LACEPADVAPFFCSEATGVAQAGSGASQTRVSLCNQTLACLRNTGCYQDTASNEQNVISCYCGSVALAECTAQNANGPCHTQFEKGFESGSPAAMKEHFYDTGLGAGLATTRAMYDVFYCPDAGCFP
jgi:hypothetical protein